MERGACSLLNLGCLSKAASGPISGAKVPHAITLRAVRPTAATVWWVRWQANAQQASRSRGIRHRWLALESVIGRPHIKAVPSMVCRRRPKSFVPVQNAAKANI